MTPGEVQTRGSVSGLLVMVSLCMRRRAPLNKALDLARKIEGW